MNLPHFLVILSVAISFFGLIPYIRDTIKGTTKPNRVSWGLWALAPIIGAFASHAANGDIWVNIRVFFAGFCPLIVFVISFFNTHSYWKLTTFDLLCGVFSVAALVIWIFMDQPVIAVLVSALADLFATLPTLVKSWRNPSTETGSTYVAYLISCILVLPSIPVWDIQNAAFPLYLLAANVVVTLAIYRKKLQVFFS